MFVRFQGAILFAALTAVAGSALEKTILDLRRATGRQHYRIEALRERVARARLRTERLSALTTLAEPLEQGRLEPNAGPSPGGSDRYEPPLLHWRAIPEKR
ncbi:MAG: hypothetical protein WBC44_19810 [Planctomycetaceae bacterium]